MGIVLKIDYKNVIGKKFASKAIGFFSVVWTG